MRKRITAAAMIMAMMPASGKPLCEEIGAAGSVPAGFGDWGVGAGAMSAGGCAGVCPVVCSGVCGVCGVSGVVFVSVVAALDVCDDAGAGVAGAPPDDDPCGFASIVIVPATKVMS